MNEEMRSRSVCFTGHRDIPLSEREELYLSLLSAIDILYSQGMRYFCCGGALGFDMLAERAVVEKKKEYSDIKLLLFLPFPKQAERYKEKDKTEYMRMISEASAVSFASEEYTKYCMHTRNRQLVDASCCCVAYLTHPSGGTFYTVNYAKRENIKLINLANSEWKDKV